MQSTPAGRPLASAAAFLDRIAGSRWFAYGSISLIQARLLWGIWAHRDLTSGDTGQYFVDASRWTHSVRVNPLWSPLYTVLWGSLRWIIQDPYSATILHRALIALGATLLVLAVLRRLVSPAIAWTLAVWWAILPVNYDPLYEVHLFALLLELAAVLIALSWRGLRMRAGVFGLLLATAVLLRNEIALALAIWTAAWIAYEVRERHRGLGTASSRLVAAVAVPVFVVTALMVGGLVRSDKRDGWSAFQAKQEISFCQAYAVSYQQRHDDFTGSPFEDCGRLMERDFGKRRPTLADAISANPDAIAEHFGWNMVLLPDGIQDMLFDRISGGENHNPDYAPVKTNSSLALFGSVVLAGFLIGGLVLLWRQRDRWWRNWIGPRIWGWLALGSLAATIVPVLLYQRPRPEYLYGLSVFILALSGLCAMAYAERWPLLKRVRVAVPVAAVLLIALIPAHYTSGYQTPQIGRPGRPLKAMVDRLRPMRDELTGDQVHLLATYASAGCDYIGEDEPCTPVEWRTMIPRASAVGLRNALAAADVDFIYIDRDDVQDPTLRGIADTLMRPGSGWIRIGPQLAAQGWTLLRRASSRPVHAASTSGPGSFVTGSSPIGERSGPRRALGSPSSD